MTELPQDQCRAEVVAGGITTRYVVAGQGPIAVLLSNGHPEGPGVRHLLGRFRVLAPVMPVESRPEPLSAWLDGFLEGLGLCHVLLLVDLRLEAFARAFAARSPDRVRAVVPVIPSGDIDFEVAPGRLGA
jgi:pimeloyl-ACP methyl ester carboxylesterase